MAAAPGSPVPSAMPTGPFHPDLQDRPQHGHTPPWKSALFFPGLASQRRILSIQGTLSQSPSICSGRDILGLGGGGWGPGFLVTCLAHPPAPSHLLRTWPPLRGKRVTQVLCALTHLSSEGCPHPPTTCPLLSSCVTASVNSQLPTSTLRTPQGIKVRGN